MNKFVEYNLNLSDKQKDLINDYLEEILDFVEYNLLDKELYYDIEEMVFEKISSLKQINELNLRKIIKEVWAPDIIFSEYMSSKKNKKNNKHKNNNNKYFFIELIENWWVRDNKNAIFLWVSKPISDKLSISVWLVRIALFILLIPMGLSLWIYILAWFLMPVKWHNYQNFTNIKYFKIQLWLLIKDSIYNTLKSVTLIFSKFYEILKKFWKKFFKKIIFILKKIFKFFFKILKLIKKIVFPVIRYWISLPIIFVIFCIILFLLILLSLWYTEFSWLNINFSSLMTLDGNLWIISLLIFFLYLLYSVGKYCFLKKFMFSLNYIFMLISLFSAFFFFSNFWFNLTENFSNHKVLSQSVVYELWNSDKYLIDFSDLINSTSANILSLWIQQPVITLKKAYDENIKIEILNNVYWKDKNILDVKNNLSKIIVDNWRLSDDEDWFENELRISYEWWNIFSKKSPAVFINREIIIYLPEKIKIKSSPHYWYYFSNVSFPKKYDYLNFQYWEKSCKYDNIIYYNNEKDTFLCNPSDIELTVKKQEYLETIFSSKISDLFPIKHKNEYKRNYHVWYLDIHWTELLSDWNILINSINNNIIDFNLSDQSLNINWEIIFSRDSENIDFWELVIKKVESNYDIFDFEYYENKDLLEKYIK